MKFSYDRVWADGVSMARSHVELLLVLAGVFLLLPDFARELFYPLPAADIKDLAGLRTVGAYFQTIAFPLFLLGLCVILGSAAILSLLLDRRQLTVGQAIMGALSMLLSILVLNWFTQVVIFSGFVLLFVPGIYLLGRLTVATAAQMAERIRNPLKAFSRAVELSRGTGWRIAGIVILLFLVATLITRVVTIIFGIVFVLILPDSALPPVSALLASTLSAISTLLMLVLQAAIYRQLIEIKRGI